MSTDAQAAVVIPARYGSTRFPGKALADKTGRPMIAHVCEQAGLARRVTRILVATDDERIADAVRTFGWEAVMTRSDHPNGTSRLAEVAESLDDRLIVNVQGDEPEIDPAVIDLVIETLADCDCSMATVASPFRDDEDPSDPNMVKVVATPRGRAMYFSRSVIPYNRSNAPPVEVLKHVGLYAYRRSFLKAYPDLPPTPLEAAEQLEQLRVLEHGREIAVAVAACHHHGIDTPEQYAAFVERYRQQDTEQR